MIKKNIIFFIFFLFSSISYSDENNDLIEKFLTKFKSINNIEFNFIQTSADMVEKGKCFLSYPKKLICRYEGDEGKEMYFLVQGQAYATKVLNDGEEAKEVK